MSRHPVTVAAPRGLSEHGAPYLLQRDDHDFVKAVLADLPTTAGRARLTATRAAARDDHHVLKLYQPSQRRFHMALVEAWCETAGRPRLDPAKVDAAGLVLRRVRNRGGRRVLEGWMRADGVVRGWMPVERLGAEEADPAPGFRLARKGTGVATLDRALAALTAGDDASTLEEDVAPMFVAPPDVCACAGHTVYYGVVQTTSSELADAEPDVAALFEGFEADSAAFRDHLVGPLRGQSFTFPTPPDDGHFDADWLEELLQAPATSAQGRFLTLLRQITVEFDAFGTSAPSRALLARLRDIHLEYPREHATDRRRTVRADTFLAEARRVLLEGESGRVEMPERWPSLGSGDTSALARTLSDAVRERFRSVKGRPGRFDEPDATYVLRSFVRLKADACCPARTVWSDYTEPFVIAPWYETAGDPVQISLPDLSNRNLLKSLKPNVAFTLPPALQNLLGGNPKDLMEGKGGGGSVGIGWICSFSIPVITFCAFIVLNIFLSLFDLIFRWMLFIKICIPYPKAK